MTGEEMYEAVVAERAAEAAANPVMVRQRDGRLSPRPAPQFTAWGRLPSALRAQWELKASLESPISSTEEQR